MTNAHQMSVEDHQSEMEWVRQQQQDARDAVARGERIADYSVASFWMLKEWAKAGDERAAAEIKTRRGF